MGRRAVAHLCSAPVGFGQGLELLVQIVEQRNQQIEHHHDHQQCEKGCERVSGPLMHLPGSSVPAEKGIGGNRRNNEIAVDIELCVISTDSAQRVAGVHIYVALDTYAWYKLRAIFLPLRFTSSASSMRTMEKQNCVQFFTILP